MIKKKKKFLFQAPIVLEGHNLILGQFCSLWALPCSVAFLLRFCLGSEGQTGLCRSPLRCPLFSLALGHCGHHCVCHSLFSIARDLAVSQLTSGPFSATQRIVLCSLGLWLFPTHRGSVGSSFSGRAAQSLRCGFATTSSMVPFRKRGTGLFSPQIPHTWIERASYFPIPPPQPSWFIISFFCSRVDEAALGANSTKVR